MATLVSVKVKQMCVGMAALFVGASGFYVYANAKPEDVRDYYSKEVEYRLESSGPLGEVFPLEWDGLNGPMVVSEKVADSTWSKKMVAGADPEVSAVAPDSRTLRCKIIDHEGKVIAQQEGMNGQEVKCQAQRINSSSQ